MLLKGEHCMYNCSKYNYQNQNIKLYLQIIFVYQKALMPTLITNIFTTEYPCEFASS